MTGRGQGAFEYILMLSGVLLIVILILMMLQGSISSTNNTITENQNKYGGTVKIDFVDHRAPNLFVAGPTGGITAGTPCCANQEAEGVSRCEGQDGTSTTAACVPASLDCPSKYFNNATGTCG